jgi:predicted nucleic acid-binding protein
MARALFIDTWGWVALGHRRDSRHLEVSEVYRTLRDQNRPIYTSDYVLDEAITLIFRREVYADALRFITGLLKSADQKFFAIERISAERFLEAWKLRQRFQDKPLISFTDLTSMVLMQEHHIKQILTDDDHFEQVGMKFQRVP